jgi:hypothetical protein
VSTTSIGGFANWSNFSDGRFKRNIQQNVPGIEFIKKLRPVTYTLDVDAINNFNSRDLPEDRKIQNINPDKSNQVLTGFVAQGSGTSRAIPGLQFSGVDKPEDESKQTYALRYGDFVVPLVKAVQEQQALIEMLEQRIAALEQKSN